MVELTLQFIFLLCTFFPNDVWHTKKTIFYCDRKRKIKTVKRETLSSEQKNMYFDPNRPIPSLNFSFGCCLLVFFLLLFLILLLPYTLSEDSTIRSCPLAIMYPIYHHHHQVTFCSKCIGYGLHPPPRLLLLEMGACSRRAHIGTIGGHRKCRTTQYVCKTT